MNHKEYIIPIGEEAKEIDEMFIGVIRKQPELIRCKDCKHFTYELTQCDTSSGLLYPSGEDYCSRAERKEE